MKTETSKSRKTGIFPKGLVHGYGQNWQFRHLFILGKKGYKNVIYGIP